MASATAVLSDQIGDVLQWSIDKVALRNSKEIGRLNTEFDSLGQNLLSLEKELQNVSSVARDFEEASIGPERFQSALVRLNFEVSSHIASMEQVQNEIFKTRQADALLGEAIGATGKQISSAWANAFGPAEERIEAVDREVLSLTERSKALSDASQFWKKAGVDTGHYENAIRRTSDALKYQTRMQRVLSAQIANRKKREELKGKLPKNLGIVNWFKSSVGNALEAQRGKMGEGKDAGPNAGAVDAVDRLNKAWENLSVTVGSTLLPIVEVGANLLARVIGTVDGLAQKFPRITGAIAGGAVAFGALQAVIAPVLYAFTFLTGGVLQVIRVGLSLGRAFQVVATAFRLLSAAFMTNPIGLAVAGIALAVGLIIANWETLKPWISMLWDGILWIINQAWEGIKFLFAWSPLGLLIQLWEPIAGRLGGGVRGR